MWKGKVEGGIKSCEFKGYELRVEGLRVKELRVVGYDEQV